MLQYRRTTTFALLAALAGCGSDPTGPQPPDAETIARMTIALAPGVPSLSITAGYTDLGLETERDGYLFVPVTYNPDIEAALIVLMHGAGASSDQWATEDFELLAESYGAVILAIDSRYETWDMLQTGEYDEDVEFLRRALAFTFDRVNVDPARITIGGFSDGAAEAIGLGLANAHLFTNIIAFSPGVLETPFKRGEPRTFLSHGRQDPVAPFSYTENWIVPKLRQNGVSVTFHEFDGEHVMPPDVQAAAFEWLFTDGG